MGSLARLIRGPWAIVVVLAFAAAIRGWGIAEWSLWEDEETSIHFSQQPWKPFPSYFPVFFRLLRWFFHLTGVSVVAGRVLSATFGLVSIWLTYVCFRKWIPREAAVIAALVITMNLGHVFWSQSIRYYTLTLLFQLLCTYWFLDGFERRSYVSLLLSNVAFVLALLTHFSAIMLAPVLVGYIALMIWRRESEGAYNAKGYAIFGVPFLVVMGWFASVFLQFQKLRLTAPGAEAAAQDPINIGIRVAIYFGVPAIILSLLAPVVGRRLPKRIMIFLLMLGFLPALELIVIGHFNLAVVAWYYALFSLLGLATLASVTLVELYQQGYCKLSAVIGSGTALYYAAFLVAYYTTFHGDRPRWAEASAFLCDAAHVRVGADQNPEILATVPGVVAFYLGVDPAETMGHPLVKQMSWMPPNSETSSDQWFVAEASVISREYRDWFSKHCELKAKFETHCGPKDRSVLVFYRPESRN